MSGVGKIIEKTTFSTMWMGYKVGFGVADVVGETMGVATLLMIKCKRARLRRGVYMMAVC